MNANPLSPCPGGCTEGAMCPSCFRDWQLQAQAHSLRYWLRSFGGPANDVRRSPPPQRADRITRVACAAAGALLGL